MSTLYHKPGAKWGREDREMTKRLNYRALIFFHAIAIIFISSLSSFADTTKIIYDETQVRDRV